MNFIWNTSLTLIDLGASFVYYLLGRHLTDDDVRLVRELFKCLNNYQQLKGESCLRYRIDCLLDQLSHGKDTQVVPNDEPVGHNLLQADIFNLFKMIDHQSQQTFEHRNETVDAQKEHVNPNSRTTRKILDILY